MGVHQPRRCALPGSTISFGSRKETLTDPILPGGLEGRKWRLNPKMSQFLD